MVNKIHTSHEFLRWVEKVEKTDCFFSRSDISAVRHRNHSRFVACHRIQLRETLKKKFRKIGGIVFEITGAQILKIQKKSTSKSPIERNP